MFTSKELPYFQWLINGIIVGVFGILVAYSALALFIIPLFWSVPGAYIFRRYGLVQGALTFATAFFIWFYALDLNSAVALLGMIAPLAVIIGFLFNTSWSLKKILTYAALATVIINFGIYLSTYSDWQQSFAQMKEETRTILPEIVETYERAALESGQVVQTMDKDDLEEYVMTILQNTWELMPSIIISTAAFLAYTNSLFLYRFLRKKELWLPKTEPTRNWKLPWFAIWLPIMSIATFLLQDVNSYLGLVGRNLMLITALFSLIYGFAVISYYWHKWRLSRAFRVILLILFVVYWPIVCLVVILFGIFDPILNFRRLGISSEKE